MNEASIKLVRSPLGLTASDYPQRSNVLLDVDKKQGKKETKKRIVTINSGGRVAQNNTNERSANDFQDVLYQCDVIPRGADNARV